MWRHPALRPLSREHFAALLVGRDVRWAAHSGDLALIARANRVLVRAWRQDLSGHFDREDRCLRPVLTAAECQELDRQHAALRAAFAQVAEVAEPDPLLALACAEALHDHARWEESTLFMALQARLSDAELAHALASLDAAGT